MPLPQYTLRFDSLVHPGRAYSFPCDESGNVHELSPTLQSSFDHILDQVGYDYAHPEIIPLPCQPATIKE